MKATSRLYTDMSLTLLPSPPPQPPSQPVSGSTAHPFAHDTTCASLKDANFELTLRRLFAIPLELLKPASRLTKDIYVELNLYVELSRLSLIVPLDLSRFRALRH